MKKERKRSIFFSGEARGCEENRASIHSFFEVEAAVFLQKNENNDEVKKCFWKGVDVLCFCPK